MDDAGEGALALAAAAESDAKRRRFDFGETNVISTTGELVLFCIRHTPSQQVLIETSSFKRHASALPSQPVEMPRRL